MLGSCVSREKPLMVGVAGLDQFTAEEEKTNRIRKDQVCPEGLGGLGKALGKTNQGLKYFCKETLLMIKLQTLKKKT